MSKIKIFALGGLNENGKNMYVVDVDDNMFIFDAGLKYPTSKMLGVDYIIPKLDYLIENKEKIKGIFISHAKIEVGGFAIFPVALTHSTPETVAYVLYTDDGAIVYATDFVFDSSMLGAYKTDIGKLAYVGKQGVLCLLAESSYAYRKGHTSPYHRISAEVWDIINQAEGRIIISVFPEHIYRIQEIFDQVSKTNRKVVLMGKKLQDMVSSAHEMGYLTYREDQIGDLANVNDEKVIIITSDNKEKSYASLEKIISGYDKFIKKHVLHHASSEDLMQMINLMNPKYYFPIKGEYRYQYMNAAIAEELDIPKENIILKQNGDVATFIDGKLSDDTDHIQVEEVLIDGNKADDIGELVLKDRELLSKNGIVIVSATIDKKTKQIIANPQILTRGFIYVKENLDIVNKAEEISKEVILSCIENGKKVDFTKIKLKIRESLGNYFMKETGSIPMIITVVLEV